jgi:mannobiose 2-epimerase
LSARLAALWFEHGPDGQHGGFHGTLDRQWRPVGPSHKGLVQQARHLWATSVWYERREQTPSVRALADSCYHFLTEYMALGDGEFALEVSREGQVVDGRRQLYGQSYAIFALATYGRVCGEPEAVEAALLCFRSIDARAHDDVHGGYNQREDGGWLAPPAVKCTNTHIHLMEAYTALFDATGDALVGSRLRELLNALCRVVEHTGTYVPAEFFADWRPTDNRRVSFGHDIETAWLMLDADRSLGAPLSEDVVHAALRMGEYSARSGYDVERGGFFEHGVPSDDWPLHVADRLAAVIGRHKVWWVQAEALAGLLWLYRLTGRRRYLEQWHGTLNWMTRHQWDHEFGGFHWSVDPDGGLGPHGAYKGEKWKTSYHELRALLFCEPWLEQMRRP